MIISTAVFSECRLYRYTLTRIWDGKKKLVAFIGVNPSTADESADDPTIRRCIAYAKAWGYGGIVMLNLFGYRSTDPKGLLKVNDPIGPDNDKWLKMVRDSMAIHEIIAAWGVNGTHNDRDATVKAMFCGRLRVLGLTKAGHPKHPLYLKKGLYPTGWDRLIP